MSDVHVIAAGAGETLGGGSIAVRVLEDGTRTDNRIGAVEITLSPGASGPPQHLHRMHDETFLITRGTVRFIMGDRHVDAQAGDYVVVPIGAPHTFANPTDQPAAMFNTFTPAFYVDYLREVAALAATEGLSPAGVLKVMSRYATLPA